MDSTAFTVVALAAILVQSFLLFLAFFEPGLPYKVTGAPAAPVDSDGFLRIVGTLTDAQVHDSNRVEVLTNGERFYAAELAAIRAARSNINLEAYIFQRGEIGARFVQALAERARAGVRVKVIVDAIGSFRSGRRMFRELIHAGGCVSRYQPFRWYNLPRINHRTHRELLVVDGRVAFLGGAGIADQWVVNKPKRRRWRDTMVRVEGGVVASLQATFAENWLEASGEVITTEDYFPLCEGGGKTTALVVNSSPSMARGTRARILFQTLLSQASRTVLITTPYFLPDHSIRAELTKAIRERGVDVRIIVPGRHSDHLLTRRSSRRLYGELLKAGARIYEYRPAMIHAKTMIVDGVWSVVGSTNFDHRSFGLNDEVNMAALDRSLAARLEDDFERDASESSAIKLREWRSRPVWERLSEWFGWVLERQE